MENEKIIKSISVGEDGLHYSVGSHGMVRSIKEEWKLVTVYNEKYETKMLVYRGYGEGDRLLFEIEVGSKIQLTYY